MSFGHVLMLQNKFLVEQDILQVKSTGKFQMMKYVFFCVEEINMFSLVECDLCIMLLRLKSSFFFSKPENK